MGATTFQGWPLSGASGQTRTPGRISRHRHEGEWRTFYEQILEDLHSAEDLRGWREEKPVPKVSSKIVVSRVPRAFRVCAGDAQSEPLGSNSPRLENRLLILAAIGAWHSAFVIHSALADLGERLRLGHSSQASESVPELADPAPTQEAAHEILTRLGQQGLSNEVRRTLVLEAEVLPFLEDQRPELVRLLRGFVEENRDSNDPMDQVAVGSAIRKLVFNLEEGDWETAAALLEVGPRGELPLEVELEVAKSLVYRLVAEPPNDDDAEPILGERLFEIVSGYLNARLLPRTGYAATALNAVLGLLLLRSRHVDEALEQLSNLEVGWFTELVARRARQLSAEIRDRHASEQSPRYTAALERASRRLSGSQD